MMRDFLDRRNFILDFAQDLSEDIRRDPIGMGHVEGKSFWDQRGVVGRKIGWVDLRDEKSGRTWQEMVVIYTILDADWRHLDCRVIWRKQYLQDVAADQMGEEWDEPIEWFTDVVGGWGEESDNDQ